MRIKRVQQMVYSAMFAALIAICAQIQIPLSVVPVNLALIAIHLSAALLGAKGAVTATVTYTFLGLLGLPVFTGLAGGPGILFGPTGGYILGYILSAWVTASILAHRQITYPRLCFAMASGTLLCCLSGMVWFMLLTGTAPAAAFINCVLPFLPGDAVKVLLSALLAQRLRSSLCQ